MEALKGTVSPRTTARMEAVADLALKTLAKQLLITRSGHQHWVVVDMTTPPSYGAYIRALRESRGVTLNGLAAQIGISLAYWSRIERDKENPPKVELIEAAARVLESDPDASFVAAGRLPPDLRPHLSEIVEMWRRSQKRKQQRQP